MSPNSQHLVYHSTNMLNCKATQKLQRAINLPWHLLNWRMLKSLHRRAGHYWGMDICFRDSFLSLQHSQENLCPTSSLGARLNRSKHLMCADNLEFTPATFLSQLCSSRYGFVTPRKLLYPASKTRGWEPIICVDDIGSQDTRKHPVCNATVSITYYEQKK